MAYVTSREGPLAEGYLVVPPSAALALIVNATLPKLYQSFLAFHRLDRFYVKLTGNESNVAKVYSKVHNPRSET